MKIYPSKVTGLCISNILLTLSGPIFFYNCSNSEGNSFVNKIESNAGNVGFNKSSNYKGFKTNIEKSTIDNKDFRKVLYTSEHNQLVLMSLKPNEEIGEEIHPSTDQFFRFEVGRGKCIIDGTTYEVKDGDAIIVPAGAKHNVINMDASKDLKFYTIYSPPHHKDGIVRKTKKDAKSNPEEFDGITTEQFESKKK